MVLDLNIECLLEQEVSTEWFIKLYFLCFKGKNEVCPWQNMFLCNVVPLNDPHDSIVPKNMGTEFKLGLLQRHTE